METNNTSVKKRTLLTRHPFAFFLTTLAILLALIVVGNYFTKPAVKSDTQEIPAKAVTTFQQNQQPTIQVQAQIKKAGVISIQAQTSGIIQKIYKKEGDSINKGTNLFWIASNYTGGTLSTTQRQQAQRNYQNTQDTYNDQKDSIQKQRDIAQQNRTNTEELRKISDKTLSETRDLVNLNDAQYKTVTDALTLLQQNNAPSASESAQIAQLKGQQIQLSAGINQLRQSLRATEYQTDTDNSPTKLAELQYQLTLQQLTLQEKALSLQKDMSKYALQIAQIGESLNYPTSPINGTIERINVTPGQLINPGEVLAVITSIDQTATAEAFVPQNTITQLSTTESSHIQFGNEKIPITPLYIATQATTGSLYSIKYQIPDPYVSQLANSSYATIEIPLIATHSDPTPIVPLDSIYQTQDSAYVFVAEKSDDNYSAKTKKIQLGTVTGNYVQVLTGINESDIIITDRNILEGDKVTIKN